MSIYGLSDLHLSFNKPVNLYQIDAHQDIDKPMDVFGWQEHYHQIRDCWMEQITEQDTVLIPGDISWALKLEQAVNDFQWIAQLPGKKVLSPGNHCYYVQSKKKVRAALPDGLTWIDADYTVVEDYVVAGTRGWLLPGDPHFQEENDRKIYERQVGRLRMALEESSKHHPSKKKVVMLHYPPLTKKVNSSGFFDLLTEFDVKLCVYGHLHGAAAEIAVEGNIKGVQLQLVACDALEFCPLPLSPILE